VYIFVLFVNRNFVLYYDHKCSLTTPQQCIREFDDDDDDDNNNTNVVVTIIMIVTTTFVLLLLLVVVSCVFSGILFVFSVQLLRVNSGEITAFNFS